MRNVTKRLRSLILLGIATAWSAGAAVPDTLTAAADLFGARLGMTRVALLARAPGACTGLREGAPGRMFAQCGPRALSAGFTSAGRAWWVTASYDLTGTVYRLRSARDVLVARYGRPVDLEEGTLVWLPDGSTADPARCLGQAMLLTAVADTGKARDPARGLPPIDAGCLPIRSALLVEHAGHRGVIVELRDPRGRVAELTR